MSELQQFNAPASGHEDIQVGQIQTEESTFVSKPKLTKWAALSVVTAMFCGCLPYGYALGSVNAASLPIKKFIKDQYTVRYNTTISNSNADAIFVVIAASFPVGGVFGCFLVRPTVKRFGKLKSMAYLHSITICMALLMGLSKLMMLFEVIIIGQLVVGIITSSAGAGISPMYCIEVVPKHWRGTFGGLVSFFISFGVFFSNVLGLPQVLGNDTLWPLLLGLIAFPALIYLLCCKFMASSPRTLYLTMEDAKGAETLLKKLRNAEDVSDEMNALAKEKRDQNSTKLISIIKLFRSRSLRRQVVATLVIASCQQLSGLNGVIAYMNQLYLMAGVPPSLISYCSVGVTALLAFTTLAMVTFLDRWGRLPWLVYGFVGQGTSLILLTITSAIQSAEPWVPYLSLVFAAVFLISFAVGPGPVTLLVVSEFFPQSSRPAAMTVACVCIFISFATTIVVWPYMQMAMGGFAYLPFAVVTLGCAVYVRLAVPETKGRTFVETAEAFRAKRVVCFKPTVSCLALFKGLTTQTSYLECPAGCNIANVKLCGTGTYASGQICAGAIHDGKITQADGGLVQVSRAVPTVASFTGSLSNGVTSTSCTASTSAYTFPVKAISSTAYYVRPADGSCPTPFTNNVDVCASVKSYCKNGGTCVGGVNSFQCSCPYGATGANCAITAHNCHKKACQNGGTCVVFPGHLPACQCPGVFTGPYCNLVAQACLAGVHNSSVVKDSQMTASSHWGNRFAYRARLYSTISPDVWTPSPPTTGSWLQVDFLKPVRLFGVITKGSNQNQWTTKFIMQYGDSTSNLKYIRNATNGIITFNSNMNWFGEVTVKFPVSYVGRYWRYTVQGFTGWPSLQLDYFTC